MRTHDFVAFHGVMHRLDRAWCDSYLHHANVVSPLRLVQENAGGGFEAAYQTPLYYIATSVSVGPTSTPDKVHI
jgi:hypothetical protein